MTFEPNTVIRVNLAWVSIDEASDILDNIEYEVYLDYPSGRTKPPVPKITLREAIRLSNHHKVKYFAYSNAESVSRFHSIKNQTNSIVVPKIETKKGVELLPKLIKAGAANIMLDKEDLYTDVCGDFKIYEKLLEQVRCFQDKVKIIELQGVVFNE